MVQKYMETRLELGLGKTLSPESLRELKWYSTNHVEDDYDLQLKLDTSVGFSVYFACDPPSLQRSSRS